MTAKVGMHTVAEQAAREYDEMLRRLHFWLRHPINDYDAQLMQATIEAALARFPEFDSRPASVTRVVDGEKS